MFIMIGIFFLIMYFMIIRPQNKRTKEHQSLINSLEKGDEIATNGGMLGKVTHVGESSVRLTIAEGVEIRIRKAAISDILPKGSLAKSD